MFLIMPSTKIAPTVKRSLHNIYSTALIDQLHKVQIYNYTMEIAPNSLVHVQSWVSDG